MAMYTIKDTNAVQTASSFRAAIEIIYGWYDDYAAWATGDATPEQHEIVRDAITSVDEPEFGESLQDFADAICTAIAQSCGTKDFHGHGNYAVRAADRMGLSLTVEQADADVVDGVYFLHPEGGDWIAIEIRDKSIVGVSCGADLSTHNAARDSWAGIEPSESDETIDGDLHATIVRIYAAHVDWDYDADLIVVSKPAEDESDDEPKTATITVTWSEISGEGRLIARCDENPTYSSNVVRWENPIDASTDSWAIAHAVTSINGAEIISVDHERDTVLVTVSNELQTA